MHGNEIVPRVTRRAWLLVIMGLSLWAASPLLWWFGYVSLDVSLFIGSTALLPWLIYVGTKKERDVDSAG